MSAVLDIGLPRRDGFSVLRHWRANRLDLAVIVLTAADDLANRLRGLNDGADDYLSKPFNFDILRFKVHNLLKNQQLAKKRIEGKLKRNRAIWKSKLPIRNL